MIDPGLRAGVFKGVSAEEFALCHGFADFWDGGAACARRRELNAVVGQHCVHLIGHGFDEVTQEVS